MSDETTVTREESRSRYEIHVGDELGGYLYFRPQTDGRVILPHTVIQPEFAGRGLGSILAGEALADLARRGDIVVPTCPFVTKYLKGNEVAGLIIDWPEPTDGTDAANPPEPA
jgi:uncharacterized protein